MFKTIAFLSLTIPVLAIPQIVHSKYLRNNKFEYRSGQWSGWSTGPTGHGLDGRLFNYMYKKDGDNYWVAWKYEQPTKIDVDFQNTSRYSVSCFWRQIETDRGWVKEDEMEPGKFLRWLLNYHCG